MALTASIIALVSSRADLPASIMVRNAIAMMSAPSIEPTMSTLSWLG
jgi:hypothetical protein